MPDYWRKERFQALTVEGREMLKAPSLAGHTQLHQHHWLPACGPQPSSVSVSLDLAGGECSWALPLTCSTRNPGGGAFWEPLQVIPLLMPNPRAQTHLGKLREVALEDKPGRAGFWTALSSPSCWEVLLSASAGHKGAAEGWETRCRWRCLWVGPAPLGPVLCRVLEQGFGARISALLGARTPINNEELTEKENGKGSLFGTKHSDVREQLFHERISRDFWKRPPPHPGPRPPLCPPDPRTPLGLLPPTWWPHWEQAGLWGELAPAGLTLVGSSPRDPGSQLRQEDSRRTGTETPCVLLRGKRGGVSGAEGGVGAVGQPGPGRSAAARSAERRLRERAVFSVYSVSTDDFQVIGPSVPIVAMLGGDAILPCSLVPAMNAEDLEQLRWFRTKFSEVVFVYQNCREQHEEQMPQYTGRTSLVRDLLTQGQAAVRIQKVQVSDNGRYTCFFQKGDYYEEATLELQVAGLGSAPQVHIEGPEQDGVRVVCKASGWFPKPQVQWTDLSGKKFLEFSEAHAQDAAGLFSVEAALVVRDSSAGSVSCSVLNPILGQEKAMAVSIPAWRKAQLYADWRKERFQAWSVTLDPGSAHQTLAVSPERKSVTCQTTPKGPDDIYSVLGLEGITSGRCYWEVEISKGKSGDWVLGVCREHVTSTGWCRESPDEGFWVVSSFYNSYLAWTKPLQTLSLRQDPRRVGIFLDYSEGDVSFYNMTDGSHIFSFPKASFSGTLFPCFMLQGDMTLTICSTEKGSEGLPVPLSKSPSLEGAVRPPGEGLSSGSGVDGSPPGAESPLLP
ncbi:butyrophilin subfamily 1 member A1-like [Lepus europaeus]|uniref:butyrophilin subfamily 1 member A1-like n=1 Tax=Lepus europaeus TaxID=9983 RepID=UPI002B4654AE|nr:butyrophilin subfamily 1 member A1-like [Lepus europaeus]